MVVFDTFSKARLLRRFLSRQLDAISVAQLQNRTCKPGAIFSAICRRDIATLARQKLHRVTATKTGL